jgi:hypothetical protein
MKGALARVLLVSIFVLVTVDAFTRTGVLTVSSYRCSSRPNLPAHCLPANARDHLDAHRRSSEQDTNVADLEKRKKSGERSVVDAVRSLLIACSMSLYLIGGPFSASGGGLLDEFGSDGSKIVDTSINYQSSKKGENAIDPTLRACKCG